MSGSGSTSGGPEPIRSCDDERGPKMAETNPDAGAEEPVFRLMYRSHNLIDNDEPLRAAGGDLHHRPPQQPRP